MNDYGDDLACWINLAQQHNHSLDQGRVWKQYLSFGMFEKRGNYAISLPAPTPDVKPFQCNMI